MMMMMMMVILILNLSVINIIEFKFKSQCFHWLYIILWLFSLTCKCNVSSHIVMTHKKVIRNALEAEHMNYPDIYVVHGYNVSLPCDISVSPLSASDAVTLILWYRGSDISGAPIYSIDARSRHTPLISAKHFIADHLDGRASFDVSKRPARLMISPVTEGDDGQYWCRVDFRWTRTTISMVKLNVLVPPKKVTIKSPLETEVTKNIICEEGEDCEVTCESIGGNPPPVLTWYYNGRKVKNHSMTIAIASNTSSNVISDRVSQSSMTIYRISRNDLNSVITCEAAASLTPVMTSVSASAISGDLIRPLLTSISIDINLRPLKVTIVGVNRDRISAGKRIEVICHTTGSRPPAIVSWTIGGRTLTQTRDITHEGNGTMSVVSFTPSPSDSGTQLVCRSENPKLVNSAVEDHMILDVKFTPNATLLMNSNPHLQTPASVSKYLAVNEDNEILLECHVSSNPLPNRIRWFNNGKELRHDAAKGIIISFNGTIGTLVMKQTKSESEGTYRCTAYNSEGRGDSNEVFIEVLYAPKCATNFQYRSVITSLGYPTNLFCEIDAKPTNVTFYWSSDHLQDTRSVISSKLLRSKLTLVPQMNTDFGLYSCWAKNLVGIQSEPCIFNVTEKHPPPYGAINNLMINKMSPEPVSDCITNVSRTSVHLICSATAVIEENSESANSRSDDDEISDDHNEFSGKSYSVFKFNPHYSITEAPNYKVQYYLQVRDSDSRLIANMSQSDRPEFVVINLTEGVIYQFIIFASNMNGVSNEVKMMVQTLTDTNNSILKNNSDLSSQQREKSIADSHFQFDSNSPENWTFIILLLIASSVVILLTMIFLIITFFMCILKKKRNSNLQSRDSHVNSDKFTRDNHNRNDSRTSVAKQSATNESISSMTHSDGQNSQTPDVIPIDQQTFIFPSAENDNIPINSYISDIFTVIPDSDGEGIRHNSDYSGHSAAHSAFVRQNNYHPINNLLSINRNNDQMQHSAHVSVINDDTFHVHGDDIYNYHYDVRPVSAGDCGVIEAFQLKNQQNYYLHEFEDNAHYSPYHSHTTPV